MPQVLVGLESLTDRALLELIATKLIRIEEMADATQDAIDALTAQVAENTTVTGSVLTLLQGFIDQVEAAKDDPEQIQAAVDAIRTNTDALASAVASNTPAEETSDE